MNNIGWSWGNYILENSKAFGSKILTGVKDASSYAYEKSKEGISYLAEKAKPTTDKLKEGATYIGGKISDTYNNMKMKIYGENNDIIDKNGQNNFAKPFVVAEGSSKYSEIKN